jgi:hypothetical protein
VAAGQALTLTLQTLAFGPIRSLPEPLWPWLLGVALFPLAGGIILARQRRGLMPTLWLLAPVVTMLVLGLFSPAFLKFLLVASAAWSLLVAGTAHLGRQPVYAMLPAAIGAVALAGVALPGYYTDANVRDNYAGVARYLQATADPDRDLVLLNAPGQSEVWEYYDPGMPTVALPAERPPDRERTIAELETITQGRDHLYALFWATDESDPQAIVESWLNSKGFKGLESWQGNLRFVTYSLADDLVCTPMEPPTNFGEQIKLIEQCQPEQPQTVVAGQAAPILLRWQAVEEPAARYVVSAQIVNEGGRVIAQQDSEPGGGSLPTNSWVAGQTIDDKLAIVIPTGTPPGTYTVKIVLYDAGTGARLPTVGADMVDVGPIKVARPAQPLPPEIIPMSRRLNQQMGPVLLAGYDMHRLGFAHAPDTPIRPGDAVEFTFFWQAPDPLPEDWPSDLQLTIELGEQTLTAPLAGEAFPTSVWRAGEVIRGQFSLQFDATESRPQISVAGSTQYLEKIPGH